MILIYAIKSATDNISVIEPGEVILDTFGNFTNRNCELYIDEISNKTSSNFQIEIVKRSVNKNNLMVIHHKFAQFRGQNLSSQRNPHRTQDSREFFQIRRNYVMQYNARYSNM